MVPAGRAAPGGRRAARVPLLQRQPAVLQADHRPEEREEVGGQFVAAVPTADKPEDAQKLSTEESAKFATAGAQPDSMVNLDFAAIKVPGTPTLMLVDNTGKVLNVWVGKLDASLEKEVFEVL